MSALPFAQLQAFLAVARQRNFSAAARELGVSRSAVSQAVQHLEGQLHVVLLARTTRSVSLTEAGRRLMEGAAPALAQAAATLTEVSAQDGEPVGRLRLSVPRIAVPFIVDPVLPTFCARFPRIEVEVAVEDRFVDIVEGGFDAGVRDGESVERDMARLRLTEPFRYVVVATPEYFRKRGVPGRPEELLAHDCLVFRSPTSGAVYAWEFSRGRKTWRVPVRGGVGANDGLLCVSLARQGLGLAYIAEPHVRDDVREGRLRLALEDYAPMSPGFFLYSPSRSRQSRPLRLFVETAKEVLRPR